MVIGNNHNFSISFEVIEEWNVDKSFNNGLLSMKINGVDFPKEAVSATLNTELYVMLSNFKNVKDNRQIFEMEKYAAFAHIYKLTYPKDCDVDNDYSYNMTPFAFGDKDCFVFMVRGGDRVRVLAAQLEYDVEESIHILEGINVEEAFITWKEFESIMRKLEKFRMQKK